VLGTQNSSGLGQGALQPISSIEHYCDQPGCLKILLLHRYGLGKHNINISDDHIGDVYISAIGMLAESATLYTISTLTYVVLNAYENPARTWWTGVMMSMSMSCLLALSQIIKSLFGLIVLESIADYSSNYHGQNNYTAHGLSYTKWGTWRTCFCLQYTEINYPELEYPRLSRSGN
jgi:hypothetical protein